MDEQIEDLSEMSETKIVFKTNVLTKSGQKSGQISDEELESLYLSFDIDFNRKYSLWRMDVIHIRGVQQMSSEDVLKYFEDFDPNSIEWVNDLSCNVVFSDPKSSAIAMKALTTALVIKMSKHSISDSDVPVIDSDSIPVPIPPQYRWRLGVSHEKSKALLLRFATNEDQKVSGARHLSQYYAQNGFPHQMSHTMAKSDRKRNHNPNERDDDSVEDITESKRFRMRMRADDEQQLIQNRMTAKMRTTALDVKTPRKSIWERLDCDPSGNYCEVDTDSLEIAIDSESNSRTSVWKERPLFGRPLRSSISMVGNKKVVFDKNDLRTKLRKRKSY